MVKKATELFFLLKVILRAPTTGSIEWMLTIGQKIRTTISRQRNIKGRELYILPTRMITLCAFALSCIGDDVKPT